MAQTAFGERVAAVDFVGHFGRVMISDNYRQAEELYSAMVKANLVYQKSRVKALIEEHLKDTDCYEFTGDLLERVTLTRHTGTDCYIFSYSSPHYDISASWKGEELLWVNFEQSTPYEEGFSASIRVFLKLPDAYRVNIRLERAEKVFSLKDVRATVLSFLKTRREYEQSKGALQEALQD